MQGGICGGFPSGFVTNVEHFEYQNRGSAGKSMTTFFGIEHHLDWWAIVSWDKQLSPPYIRSFKPLWSTSSHLANVDIAEEWTLPAWWTIFQEPWRES